MDRAPLEQAENVCRALARLIKEKMPKHWGFCLIIMSHGGDGFMTYLSDSRREDCIKMLKELVGKLEANEKNI